MSFTAGRMMAAHTPRVRELPVAAGAGFLRGALLVKDANGAWAECGADPAAVAAVAESDYGADTSGFIHTAKKEFPPGYMQATLVSDEQSFIAEYTGTLPAADGGSYGVVRSADSKWRVDFGETTALVVKLVGRRTTSPENVAKVEVVFLPAVVQVVG